MPNQNTFFEQQYNKEKALETIEKICIALQCRVDDILDFDVQSNGHIE